VSMALSNWPNDKSLVQSGFYILRAIAGNDDVKNIINRSGGIDMIVRLMQKHLKNADVAEQGCSALAAITLRSGRNAETIAESGGVNVLVNLCTCIRQRAGSEAV